MATQNRSQISAEETSLHNRAWMIFALHGFARIVARKHSLVVPIEDYETLSDEELVTRYETIRELAHLPPG